MTKNSTPQRYFPIFPKTSLLFPYLVDNGIVYFQSRSLDDAADKGRWRNLNQRRRRLYNIDVLDDPSKKQIAICEGVIDTISAYELNISAVGFIDVSTKFTDEQISKLKKKENVQILLDWDEAGEACSSQLLTKLQ